MFVFGNPWGLLALISLGGIVFLYFFVFHGKRREVSALFLWKQEQRTQHEGNQRKRPPLNLPLFLELLAATFLSLIIADFGCQQNKQAPHLAVIIDSSISMTAQYPNASATERVRNVIASLEEKLGKDGTITLIASGPTPYLIGNRSITISKALEELKSWQPNAPDHDFINARNLAFSIADSRENVLLISDQPTQNIALPTQLIGQASNNLAWLNVRWQKHGTCFALLKCFGEKPTSTITITVKSDDKLLQEKKITFGERDSIPLSFDLPPALTSVSLHLPPDVLEADNDIYLTHPPTRTINAWVDTGSDVLNKHIKRALRADPDMKIADNRPAHIAFFNAPADSLDSSKDNHAITEVCFVHPTGDDKRSATPLTTAGPFFVDQHHPYTQGTSLDGAFWALRNATLPEEALPIVSVANTPLIAIKDKALYLNLYPKQTNIFKMPFWPVFINNLLHQTYRKMPGLNRTNYRLGESLAFPPPPAWNKSLTLIEPDGQSITHPNKGMFYTALNKLGVYTLRANGKEQARLAVNLVSSEESNLTNNTSNRQTEELKASNLTTSTPRRFTKEFGLAAASCLLLGWSLLLKHAPIPTMSKGD